MIKYVFLITQISSDCETNIVNVANTKFQFLNCLGPPSKFGHWPGLNQSALDNCIYLHICIANMYNITDTL